MKRLAIKLSFLTVLSGLFLAGLTATAGTAAPRFWACCSGGDVTCCGKSCSIGPPSGCNALN